MTYQDLINQFHTSIRRIEEAHLPLMRCAKQLPGWGQRLAEELDLFLDFALEEEERIPNDPI